MYNLAILFAVSFVSSVTTFYANEHLKYGPVRSSAMLSLAVGLFFYFFPHLMNSFLVKNIPIVFIGGSFIGMVSSRVLSNYLLIGTAGLIFCLIYINTSRFFNGYGGAVGTASAIALLAVLSLPVVTKRHRLTNGMMLLRKTLFGSPRR
ncbi:hypothetical protein SAMN06265348_101521 [Pedobacter westerhofensis]|uniref:Uncharacterized protein n=1 Tax=Pedobacter westerhofensis TaxID=425512 RepID=A0A521AXE9_9SPHI|nr:hypothetical protein [Pedobacter westerhofensis]SMO39474.1 hypothetical protein SAMN06265348_101521 [Pedobacter westerhofensis]